MQQNTIAIIGHRGFIGSHLTTFFQKKETPFCVFDGDVLNTDEVETFFLKNKPSIAVFLIGSFDPPFENLLQKNVKTIASFLEIGTKHGLRKLIYASTGAVYGEPLKNQSFEDDVLFPNTLYGLSKVYAEQCILYYHRKNNVEYVTLRFPNVYGEGNKKGVIFNFLTQIKTQRKVAISGDGNQIRNFLHVSDACIAIEKAIHYSKSGTFNISNPIPVSIMQVINILKEHFSFKVEHITLNNDLKVLNLNTDKAKEELKFETKIKKLLLPTTI